RQYATFAGTAYGRNVTKFFDRLVQRQYATVCRCVHNRAELYLCDTSRSTAPLDGRRVGIDGRCLDAWRSTASCSHLWLLRLRQQWGSRRGNIDPHSLNPCPRGRNVPGRTGARLASPRRPHVKRQSLQQLARGYAHVSGRRFLPPEPAVPIEMREEPWRERERPRFR